MPVSNFKITKSQSSFAGTFSLVNKYLDNTIWGLLCFFVLVDMLNGALERRGSFMGQMSIAQMYKAVLFLLAFLRLLNTKSFKKQKSAFLIIATYFVSVSLLQNIIFVGDYYSDLVFLYKILFNGLFFLYFYAFYREKKDLSLIRNVLTVNFIYVIVNFVLGSLGYGYSTYTNLGTKGFYYAGNELALLLIVISSFMVYRAYLKDFKLYIFWSVVSIVMATLLAMKTSIAGVFLVSLLIPIVPKIKSLKTLFTLLKYVLLIVAALVGIIYIIYNYFGTSYTLGRWIHFFDEYGIITGLLSSRDETLFKASNIFLSSFSIIWAVFGVGFSNFIEFVGKSIEIDFFDILYGYGVTGLMIIYGGWFFLIFRLIVNSIKPNNKYPYARYAFLINIVLFFASFTTGHVVYSASTGLFLAMVTSLGLVPQKSKYVLCQKIS